MLDDRPAFELESYDDTSLPQGKQLHHDGELHGHTVILVDSLPQGEWGKGCGMVIVTETLCWMVLNTTHTYSCDEAASIEIESARQHGWNYEKNAPRHVLTLHDYLGAETMLRHGLCSHAEFEVLERKEQAAKQEQKDSKAAALRKELAALEGGAA